MKKHRRLLWTIAVYAALAGLLFSCTAQHYPCATYAGHNTNLYAKYKKR